MNFVALFFISCLQVLAGFGILTLFKIRLKPAMFFSLCWLLGIAFFSVVPFVLQLLHVPLTLFSIFSSLVVLTLALNLKFRAGLRFIKNDFKSIRFTLEIYEIPFLVVAILVVAISVWRCYYLPPTPRDLNSGAEAIAEYAVREHTMINSVFKVNLESTNNVYKPPFVACLQIIYKLMGFPFGQVWLSGIFISIIIFLYHAISLTVHRLVSGLLIVCFLAIPEMYGYSFMVLFDYSNAVFFFLSVYFLINYFKTEQANQLAFASLLMGIATYTRTETLVLAAFIALAICLHFVKGQVRLKKMFIMPVIFMVPSIICYLVCVSIYLYHYLPVRYDIGEQVNTHLLNLKPFCTRFWDMNKELVFSNQGVDYYSWFIFIFITALIADIAFTRKLNEVGRNWLYAVLVIYIGLPFLGYLLPLLDLDNSTKRGLFKIFPLMLLYMANSSLLIRLSEKITKWQTPKPA